MGLHIKGCVALVAQQQLHIAGLPHDGAIRLDLICAAGPVDPLVGVLLVAVQQQLDVFGQGDPRLGHSHHSGHHGPDAAFHIRRTPAVHAALYDLRVKFAVFPAAFGWHHVHMP